LHFLWLGIYKIKKPVTGEKFTCLPAFQLF